MQFTHYNSDSGQYRDMGPETMYPLEYTFEQALHQAYADGHRFLIKTSYISEAKPGRYYGKGFRTDTNYDTVKTQLENNVAQNKFSKRECWLFR